MAKSFFTYEQQLDKLQNEKHLTINDTKYAKETLQELSYYSLIGGYKNLFKHPASGKYIHGVTFEEVVAFYYFDEELRTLFLKYILHIERHIKSLLSYYFCGTLLPLDKFQKCISISLLILEPKSANTLVL